MTSRLPWRQRRTQGSAARPRHRHGGTVWCQRPIGLRQQPQVGGDAGSKRTERATTARSSVRSWWSRDSSVGRNEEPLARDVTRNAVKGGNSSMRSGWGGDRSRAEVFLPGGQCRRGSRSAFERGEAAAEARPPSPELQDRKCRSWGAGRPQDGPGGSGRPPSDSTELRGTEAAPRRALAFRGTFCSVEPRPTVVRGHGLLGGHG